jgi:hypothetical protein
VRVFLEDCLILETGSTSLVVGEWILHLPQAIDWLRSCPRAVPILTGPAMSAGSEKSEAGWRILRMTGPVLHSGPSLASERQDLIQISSHRSRVVARPNWDSVLSEIHQSIVAVEVAVSR